LAERRVRHRWLATGCRALKSDLWQIKKKRPANWSFLPDDDTSQAAVRKSLESIPSILL